MQIFNIQDNQIVVNPETLLVEEFKVIWDSDKDKKKGNAYAEFKYIYLVADTNSPYYNFPSEKRVQFVCLECFKKDSYKESDELKAAIQKYKDCMETSSQRLLKACENKIDEAAEFLNSTKYNADNQKAINEVYKNLSMYISNKDILQQAVDKEKNNSKERRRGGGKRNKYEE